MSDKITIEVEQELESDIISCPKCGSQEIYSDATAKFDPARRVWLVESVWDNSKTCASCAHDWEGDA